MPEITLIEGLRQAMDEELARDERVFIDGEDVGRRGGVFRATQGLFEKYGAGRVIDSPLAELSIVGVGIGAALYGMRPICEIQFADFIYPAMDQIVNELSKYRYRSGGQWTCPLVIRSPYGGGIRGGHYHSQSPEAHFIHTAGLKVVVPATPADAKGLLVSAIRDPDPVLFFEPKRVYRAAKGEVPEGEYAIPLGKAKLTRAGHQISILAWGAMWYEADQAAREAEQEGIDCEVLDLRSLQPLDIDAVVASVTKTGRAVVVHEAPRTCGFGAELAALIQERCFLSLEAPVARVTGFDTPFPYTLENEYLPRAPRILQAVRETVRY
jgi:2-oxoisovalerate dehydrogenase E1 component beta subunit